MHENTNYDKKRRDNEWDLVLIISLSNVKSILAENKILFTTFNVYRANKLKL